MRRGRSDIPNSAYSPSLKRVQMKQDDLHSGHGIQRVLQRSCGLKVPVPLVFDLVESICPTTRGIFLCPSSERLEFKVKTPYVSLEGYQIREFCSYFWMVIVVRNQQC